MQYFRLIDSCRKLFRRLGRFSSKGISAHLNAGDFYQYVLLFNNRQGQARFQFLLKLHGIDFRFHRTEDGSLTAVYVWSHYERTRHVVAKISSYSYLTLPRPLCNATGAAFCSRNILTLVQASLDIAYLLLRNPR